MSPQASRSRRAVFGPTSAAAIARREPVAGKGKRRAISSGALRGEGKADEKPGYIREAVARHENATRPCASSFGMVSMSLLRARASRDITVPIGAPVTSAIWR